VFFYKDADLRQFIQDNGAKAQQVVACPSSVQMIVRDIYEVCINRNVVESKRRKVDEKENGGRGT
jgi:hypothetical protein